MKPFQDIIFIWIRTYKEIFKSTLVYLLGEHSTVLEKNPSPNNSF